MSTEDLLLAAIGLCRGNASLASLKEGARAVIGDATTPIEAAHRLFSAVPLDERPPMTSTVSPVELAGLRVAAAFRTGALDVATQVASTWPRAGYGAPKPAKLSEFEAHWLYDALFNGVGEAGVGDAAQWILTVHPDHPRANKVLAVAAIDAGRLVEAIPFLERALAANPTYASGWYNLACARSRLGEKEAMLAALQQAIEHGKKTTMMDYREEALGDKDFSAWLDDADFNALVRPDGAIPDADAIQKALANDAFDKAIRLAGKAMSAHPAHARVYAALAQKAADTVVSDLDEHDDANADDYRYGDESAYRSLSAAAAAVAASGAANDIAAFNELLGARSAE